MIFGSSSSGFTLVEVLTTVAIMASILVVVSVFQYNVIDYNRSSSVALNNTHEAQRILKTMTRELRPMGSSDIGSYSVLTAATNTITFFSNVDSDSSRERVRYFLTGSELKRGIIKAEGSPPGYDIGDETITTMVTGIKNSSTTPVFEYFNNLYPTIGTPLAYPLTLTDIRLVKVSLTIDSDPNRSPILRTFTSQVGLRNLKDNL